MWQRLSLFIVRGFSTKNNTNRKIGIVGAPFHLGQPRKGTELAPQVLRDSGIIAQLQSKGVDVFDKGDLSYENVVGGLGPHGEKNFNQVIEFNKRLADTVTSIRRENLFCLCFGGDHSTAIGSVTGNSEAFPERQMTLLWVDAHADINTGKSSYSGNMHGMPVSFLLRELATNSWPQPCINKSDIVYIGLRDVDDAENKFICDLGIKNFFMKDVRSIGLTETINRSLNHLALSGNRPLHVTFDIDSIDPEEAPSTGTPVNNGLALTEGLQIVKAARETSFLSSFDLVEVNPLLGSKRDVNRTVETAKKIIIEAITLE